ncbi:MAG TPA: hypothetical protein VN890_10095 [Methylocella sp.]|nr:hypothetical protein [Methylocella sp.]
MTEGAPALTERLSDPSGADHSDFNAAFRRRHGRDYSAKLLMEFMSVGSPNPHRKSLMRGGRHTTTNTMTIRWLKFFHSWGIFD